MEKLKNETPFSLLWTSWHFWSILE